MDTHKGPLMTEEFMAWLKDGRDMLTVERTKAWACFIKLPKREGIDYIFHQDDYQEPQSVLSRNTPFRFTGLYMKDEQKLYCPNIPACAVSDWQNDPAATEHNLKTEFCRRVRESIEEKVNNGRRGIPKELSDEKLKAEVEKYLEYRADGVAAELLIDSVPLV